MIAAIFVLLALVAMGESLPQGSPCSAFCSCTIFATFHHVNCSDGALDGLPENLHYNTTTLVFSYNSLKILRNDTFEYYPRFLQLYLDHNKIWKLEVGVFSNSRDLRVLFLDHNLLKNIPQDAFVNNKRLFWLDLSGNRLLIPDDGILVKPPSLTRLLLADCNLQDIPPDMFIRTPYLKELDLSNNSIETLLLATFLPLSGLKYLNLMGNNLNCNCKIVPFHHWATYKISVNKVEVECLGGLPWVRVGDQDCSGVGIFPWVGACVGVLLLLVTVTAVTCHVRRRRRQLPVPRFRRPPLPSLPAGPTGEYIEVVAEKTYETIRETQVARYMASPMTPTEPPDGPIYVNSFVPPAAPKSRRDRVPTYDDVRPSTPTAKMEPKARCMSLASILKDCDYYETVD